MVKTFSKLRQLLEKSTILEQHYKEAQKITDRRGPIIRTQLDTQYQDNLFAIEAALPKVLEEFDKLVDALGSAHATLEQIAKETRRPGLLACVDILDEALARIKELAGE